jgi:methionyl aminopeptidase
MEKEEAENYILAGKITKGVVETAKKSIKPGQKLLDIAIEIEKNIEKATTTTGEGRAKAKPAFPVNLSINENAAHFTPASDCSLVLEESDVLKVDVGCHIEGFICDTAFTLNFDNSHAKMIEAAELALEEGLKVAMDMAELGKIGETIERAIKGKRFNPIANLSGHGLAEFEQHAAPSIPNIATGNPSRLEDGHAYAIEPFATDGEGYVREGGQSEIFSLDKPRPVRNPYARQVLELVAEEFGELPFALRWVEERLKMPEFQRKVAMRELQRAGIIRAYPVLREAPGKFVAQAEKSFILFEGKATLLC